MQESQHSRKMSDDFASPRTGALATQLGLSHLAAGAVALGCFAWLAQLHIQQPCALLMALAAASLCGILCTFNLHYSLYLLELTLARLAHGLPREKANTENRRMTLRRRWPFNSLFLYAQEAEQRLTRYATNMSLASGLREQALQQATKTAALAERNRIARDLHDSIKQQIFSMSVSAAAVKALWQTENAAAASEAVEDIQRSAQEAQVEMQALLQQLRPAPLENTSLVEALGVQAQALGFRTGAQVHVDLDALPENQCLLPGTQEGIFRLVQEAFANIAKHARAQTIWLEARTSEHSLHIQVRDDGQGFTVATAQGGQGLAHLRERARELHGLAEITSQPGQGTTVQVTIPLLEALRNPEEEARQRYELARANELARRGYQLCSNAALLGTAMGVIGIIAFVNFAWGLAILGGLVVAISGCTRGIYYRAQVALHAGRENLATLDLMQYHYKSVFDLVRLTGVGVLYAFNLVGFLHDAPARWVLFGIFAGLVVFSQLARWRSYQDIKYYYALLPVREMGWELARRRQALGRSLLMWGVFSGAGLISSHSLFVLPPQTLAQQTAYGIAAILVVTGFGMLAEYRQLRRWQERLHSRSYSLSAAEQEGGHV